MSNKPANWEEYKASLLEGLTEKQSTMLNCMMENSHAENMQTLGDATHKNSVVLESTAPGSTTTSNISRYDTMFMPLVRRTMPALLAMDLVGVQPLSTPQGIVRTIKHRYSQDTETTDASGINEVTAGDEASGMNVYDKYSLLALGGAYDEVDTLDPFQQTVYLEGNRGKPMDLEVVTDRVTPKSRKLSAAWSLETEDDLQALDGLDVESEMSATMGDTIQRELDRELVDNLTGLAGTVESFDFANVDGRYAGEKLASLLIQVDNLSAQIAIKTKRGGATWMVVSQRVFTAMKHALGSTFVPANSGELSISSSLFVGTFGAGVRVYVDPYAEGDTVLMGLKNSELDAGFWYLPYIPLSSSGAVRNPETGDWRVMMRTRYALYARTDATNSLGDSPDFFARMAVQNLSLGFKN